MPSMKEILYAAFLMAVVLASFFGHGFPMAVQNILFVILVVSGFALVAAGWWCWIKTRNAASVPRWRKRVGLFGLAADTTALAVPFVALLYMMYYPFLRARVGLAMVDAQFLVLSVLVLSASGFIAGIFAPTRSRFPTSAAAFVIGSIALSIPIGIL